jgi:hypothetical protein
MILQILTKIQLRILICFIFAATFMSFIHFVTNVNKFDTIIVYNIIRNINLFAYFVQITIIIP